MKVPIYLYLGSQQPVSRSSGISLLRQEEQLWNARVSYLTLSLFFLFFFFTAERTQKIHKEKIFKVSLKAQEQRENFVQV